MTNETNAQDETIHQGTVENSKANSGSGSLMAIFAYLGILIVIPFITNSKNDPFVKFHIKQGLALIGFDILGWIVGIAIGGVAFFGDLITSLWSIASLVFIIAGILNVLNKQEKDLPLIGRYGHDFKF